MKQALFSMYRFVNTIMTRVFTVEYLRRKNISFLTKKNSIIINFFLSAHKKSNQGGAKGKIEKQKMSDKHLKYILTVTVYAWRKLTNEDNKQCSTNTLLRTANQYISQVFNNFSR
jgi:hypothetical protein